MKRWLIAIFFLVLIVGLIKWGTLLVGGGSYKLMESNFSQLDAVSKETIDEEFYAVGKSSNFYAGTVAKINQQGEGGVLDSKITADKHYTMEEKRRQPT